MINVSYDQFQEENLHVILIGRGPQLHSLDDSSDKPPSTRFRFSVSDRRTQGTVC